jgi:hypothetical protein
VVVVLFGWLVWLVVLALVRIDLPSGFVLLFVCFVTTAWWVMYDLWLACGEVTRQEKQFIGALVCLNKLAPNMFLKKTFCRHGWLETGLSSLVGPTWPKIKNKNER